MFVDTPGLVDPRYLLHEVMREDAEAAIADADLLLYVVDVGYAPSVEHALSLAAAPGPRILCLNKLDRVPEGERSELELRFAESGWEAIVGTVATTGRGVDRLRGEALRRLPVSPPLYPPDDLAVAPVRFFVAEIIRETVFEQLSEEVPYASAVTIQEFREPESTEETLYIEAIIHVERESQKGIVIGSSGKMVRRIGSESRRKIEEFLERRIYLDLRVKVLRNWRKREAALNLLGVRRPPGNRPA